MSLTKIEFDELSSFGVTTVRVAKQIGDERYYGLLDIMGKVCPVKCNLISHLNGSTEQLYLGEQKITLNKAGGILVDERCVIITVHFDSVHFRLIF